MTSGYCTGSAHKYPAFTACLKHGYKVSKALWKINACQIKTKMRIIAYPNHTMIPPKTNQ